MNSLVEVAISQVGYWNKTSDYQLDINGANKKAGYNGYTKYGKWFGMNPSAWCAIFVSWCGAMADCIDSVGGKISWVPDYVTIFSNRGRWHPTLSNYKPSPGDLIIFGNADHVGIVESANSETVYTIEGNANGGRVARNQYALSDDEIMGYCETRIEEKNFPVLEWTRGIYKNGSTPEPVYCDSDCVDKIGELNKFESCTKIGMAGGKTIVLYPVDETRKYKIGFVVYKGS